MSLEVRIAGVDITDDVEIEGCQFTMQTGTDPGDFAFRVRDPEKVYAFRAGQHITAKFDGYPIFDGYIRQATFGFFFPVEDVSDPDRVVKMWTLAGVDVNILFSKRVTFNQSDPSQRIDLELAPGTSDTVWVDAILDHLTLGDDNITTSVQAVASPNPDRAGLAISIGDDWGDDMLRVSRLTGAIWGIRLASNGDRVFYYEDDTSITAPFAISDTPNGSTSFGYSNYEWIDDASQMVNHARVWGAGVGKPTITYTEVRDEDSIAEHGRWEAGDTFRYDLYRQSSVNLYADSLVYGSPSHAHGPKDPSIKVKCRVVRPGLIAGQKVRIINNTFGDDVVLPIRKLRSTFVTKDQALFDIEATWDIDGPRNLYDPPPDLPPDPIDDITKEPPCEEAPLISFLDSGGWDVIRSDPRFGPTGFDDLGFYTTTKSRYWVNGGFFQGHGQDSSETYSYASRPIPWQKTNPNSSDLVPFGFTMRFRVPIYQPVGNYQPPAANPDWGDNTVWPKFSLDLFFVQKPIVGLAQSPSINIRLLVSGNNTNLVAGQYVLVTGEPFGGHDIPQSQGSWFNFEMLPNLQCRVWPLSGNRPVSPNVNANGNSGYINTGDVLPGGNVAGQDEVIYYPRDVARVIIGFQTHEFLDERQTGILITGTPSDPSNDLTLIERFLDATWPHDRAPDFLGHTVYGLNRDTLDSGDPSPIRNGYRLSCEVANVVFWPGQPWYIDGEPVCLDNIPSAPAGARYCQPLTKITDIEWQTDYVYALGSTVVSVEGVGQRRGIDYAEDPSGRLIRFAEGSVPPTADVYCCYEKYG